MSEPVNDVFPWWKHKFVDPLDDIGGHPPHDIKRLEGFLRNLCNTRRLDTFQNAVNNINRNYHEHSVSQLLPENR